MTSVIDLDSYVDKYVVLVYTEDDVQKTVEGRVIRANWMGILVRPKNKRTTFAAADEVVSVTEAEDPTVPRIRVRYVDLVTNETVRQHLADRHGVPLSDIPTDGPSALAMHNEIDHTDLGHRHEEKAAPPTPELVAKRVAAIDGEDDLGDN